MTDSNAPIDSAGWRLFIPFHEVKDRSSQADFLLALIESLNLSGLVSVVFESQSSSLDFIQSCVDPHATFAEPYLERVQGGCSAAVTHYRGEEIKNVLNTLFSFAIH